MVIPSTRGDGPEVLAGEAGVRHGSLWGASAGVPALDSLVPARFPDAAKMVAIIY